ncbi:serine/threonine-protein kinase RIO1 [Rhizophagus irregularis DAOM 181602=DAOM 197198]|nr:serine/threonine-protein kinase RIO1 [Rhizophagus irregularis DAOM 181602=DAOM 197198]
MGIYYQLIKNMIIMYHKCHADLNEYNLLYRDLSNVTEYFKRKGVRVIGELFDFITDINIGLDDEQVEAELDKIQERLASQQELSITLNEDIDKMSKDLVDEEVFKKAFIPRTLNDVFYVERDTLKVSKDEGEDLIYRQLTGLSKQSRGKQNEDKESKKERKKAAKEVAEEKRKNPKLSKCVK